MQEGFPRIVNIQDDIINLHRMGVLEPLLADRTTGGNILWATDAYAERGPQYEPTAEIEKRTTVLRLTIKAVEPFG